MLYYMDGTITISEQERAVLRELEFMQNIGGEYLYAVKDDDHNGKPLYYCVYTGGQDPKDRRFITRACGCVVECLNWILLEKLKEGQYVFSIDEIVKKYC